MLGANRSLFVVLRLTMALGFSTIDPSPDVLRVLRVVGGLFLVYLAVNELRFLRLEPVEVGAMGAPDTLGTDGQGVMLVIVNPGAWIFFGTTAAAVMARPAPAAAVIRRCSPPSR